MKVRSFAYIILLCELSAMMLNISINPNSRCSVSVGRRCEAVPDFPSSFIQNTCFKVFLVQLTNFIS